MLRFVTLGAVTLAWVAFRSPTMSAALNLWTAIAGVNGGFVPGTGTVALAGVSPWHAAGWMLAAMVIVWGLPSTKEWMEAGAADGSRHRPGRR